MPFSRPPLSTIKSQVKTDIQTALPGTDPLLRFSNLGAIGVALSHQINALYGYLDWIAKQAVPFTASGEFLYAWGSLKNVMLAPASKATNGQVTFTGSNGAVIPEGHQLSRSDGTTYTVTAEATVANGTVTVSASADTAGLIGNAEVGTVINLAVAIAGVQATGSVTTAFTDGEDTETDDAFRTRMLRAYQQQPQGGCEHDYVTWALAAPGVTRAWANGNGFGVGTVVVYVMLDDVETEHGGFPQGTDGVATLETRVETTATGDQLAVANFLYDLQPVTALVYAVAPVAVDIDFTISGLSGASATVKSAVSQAITDVFFTYGSPVGDLTLELSYIEAAIAAISGTTGFVITVPTGNITLQIGELPVLGTITYS